MKLSENIVETTLASGLMITREKLRKIKQFDRKQMTRYTVEVYKSGFEDALDAVQNAIKPKEDPAPKAEAETEEAEEVKLDWEDVLAVIRRVKGVTATLAHEIDEALRREF